MVGNEIVSSTTKTDAWHEARRAGIGGSDVAGILGLSKWESPMSVYLQKLGSSSEQKENPAMEWGTRSEAMIAAKFAEEHPEFEVFDDPEILHSDDYPFMFAHLDRWLLDPNTHQPLAGLEIKTAGRESMLHYWLDDQTGELRVPDMYVLQVMHYMIVTGLRKFYVAALFAGREYMEFEVEWDEELAQMLIAKERQFWTLVEAQTPPPIDASDATRQVLAILYRETDAVEQVDLGLEGALLAQERESARDDLKRAETRVAEVENQLKAALGHHEIGTAEGTAGTYLITWKPQTRRGGIDEPRLREVYPDIVAEFSKPDSTYRVLRVRAPKGE